LQAERRWLREVCAEIPNDSYLFMVLKHPKFRASLKNGQIEESDRTIAHRNLILSEAGRNSRVIPIDLIDCVVSDDEILDEIHYERIVYYRLYQAVARRFMELQHCGFPKPSIITTPQTKPIISKVEIDFPDPASYDLINIVPSKDA